MNDSPQITFQRRPGQWRPKAARFDYSMGFNMPSTARRNILHTFYPNRAEKRKKGPIFRRSAPPALKKGKISPAEKGGAPGRGRPERNRPGTGTGAGGRPRRWGGEAARGGEEPGASRKKRPRAAKKPPPGKGGRQKCGLRKGRRNKTAGPHSAARVYPAARSPSMSSPSMALLVAMGCRR